MKKGRINLWSVCLMLFLTVFASCTKEDTGKDLSHNNDFILGIWYDEISNEVVTYEESGYYFDRFTNFDLSRETAGSYEVGNNKELICTYSLAGRTVYSVFDIVEYANNYVKLKTHTGGSILLERVIQTKIMSVDESYNIDLSNYSNYEVLSYESKNKSIASVTSEGKVTATGEKGTTFIKIATNKGNLWAKIVVDYDLFDIWYDFPSMIGMTYEEVIKVAQNTPSAIGEDNLSFEINLPHHDLIKKVGFFLNSETNRVSEIQLQLHDKIVKSSIIDYIDSKYYKYNDTQVYITSRRIEDSRAIVHYYDNVNILAFFDKSALILLPDFSYTLGISVNELCSTFNLQKDLLIYEIKGNNFVNYVLWSIDEGTGLVSDYTLVVKENVNIDLILKYLDDIYYFYKEDGDVIAFTNRDGINNSEYGIVLLLSSNPILINYLMF